MLTERATSPESHEETLLIPEVPYTVTEPVPAEGEGRRRLEARQRADHLTATFSCLAMMQMGREG